MVRYKNELYIWFEEREHEASVALDRCDADNAYVKWLNQDAHFVRVTSDQLPIQTNDPL